MTYSKTTLINKLKENGAFWSYDKKVLDEEVPDPVLIEQALRMGNVPELLALFDLFTFEQIKQVWHERLIPHQRIYPYNDYLAKVFFKIDNPADYIKPLQKHYGRYERIKNANTWGHLSKEVEKWNKVLGK